MLKAYKLPELAAWAADWEKRKDREPWMVSNFTIANTIQYGP